MQHALFSIRMRASVHEEHLSGMERLVAEDGIEPVIRAVVSRALSKRNIPDRITISVDRVLTEPLCIQALDVISVTVRSHEEGRNAASRAMVNAGVSETAAGQAIDLLARGPSENGGNMRGAVLMDAATGIRLEPDRHRGIRTSRIDWTERAGACMDRLLERAGLTHVRTREALALASKTAHAEGMIAELCWSDDPDYSAGYVASRKIGYVRFSAMKEMHNAVGGRVYFIDSMQCDRERLIHYLQEEPVLIDSVGQCSTMTDEDAFLRKTDIVLPDERRG